METHDTIREITKVIKPKHTYAPADLVRMGTFPWARDHRTIVKLIEQDLAGENILEADVSGEGRQRRYQVVGKNIIKYLNKYAAVLMSTARKPKTYGNKN